ncbi:MAG: hypothetical protein JO272_16880 [Pseudonocardiales bacterium]|nr:hypothetical protein [Pseudonocardiales bacterium]
MRSEVPVHLSLHSRYTVESVLKGHSDKVCDQICDAILDEYLREDERSRVAVECMGSGSTLVVAGEVSSSAKVDVASIAKSIYCEIGYNEELRIIKVIGKQSEQLGRAVSIGAAGDQGVMYGFACDCIHNNLPFGQYVVNAMAREIDSLCEKTNLFRPDGKVQVTVNNGAVESLVISVQHDADTDLEDLEHVIMNEAVSKVLAATDPARILQQSVKFYNGAS